MAILPVNSQAVAKPDEWSSLQWNFPNVDSLWAKILSCLVSEEEIKVQIWHLFLPSEFRGFLERGAAVISQMEKTNYILVMMLVKGPVSSSLSPPPLLQHCNSHKGEPLAPEKHVHWHHQQDECRDQYPSNHGFLRCISEHSTHPLVFRMCE